MSILRAAVLVAALAAPAAAPSPVFAAERGDASVALTLVDALISRRPLLVEDSDASASAAQNYYDYDALLTLGALALAGGALAAWSRRSGAGKPAGAGEGATVRGIRADLGRRVAHPRDAA